MWKTNSQEVEGGNSIVKHITQLAPNISWELLSSRITIKKSGCTNLKYTKNDRDAFIARALELHTETKAFVNEVNKSLRFDMVDPSSYERTLHPELHCVRCCRAGLDGGAAAKCCAKGVAAARSTFTSKLEPSTTDILKLSVFTDAIDVRHVFIFPAMMHYSSYWVCSGAHPFDDHTGMMLEGVCEVDLPMNSIKMIDAFSQAHSDLHESIDSGLRGS
jgi:hypothetical protein